MFVYGARAGGRVSRIIFYQSHVIQRCFGSCFEKSHVFFVKIFTSLLWDPCLQNRQSPLSMSKSIFLQENASDFGNGSQGKLVNIFSKKTWILFREASKTYLNNIESMKNNYIGARTHPRIRPLC